LFQNDKQAAALEESVSAATPKSVAMKAQYHGSCHEAHRSGFFRFEMEEQAF